MSVLTNNLDLFLRAFGQTLQLFAVSAVLSLVLGTLLAALRVSPVPVFRGVGTTYVTVVRNTPLTLVFVFFVFAYPLLDILKIEPYTAAVVSLSLYTAAFVCEVVRSGINTVPVGQAEASRALGLTFTQMLGSVVLPQALRSVVPPMTSTMIALLKNTTVASGFAVVQAGNIREQLADQGDNVLIGLLWVALGFVILVMPLTYVQQVFEKRWSVAR
ncbi:MULTISPECIES: amino acid ABC transporter permease [Lentzea]|jgi:glutamate transport system permease protein|uniref:Glutamate transport system permease protein n=1 Tax=Lentzea flaviverrucosa TaxID=200379 RepID=A0A1H9XWU4_9PSEU|nr:MULTISPECIES: amino acid ABC transporter permease [Lentzea]MCR3751434.1 glutamate transport system permease protein [Lentzea californiensis]RDI17487.1 amino acid ABC transporter membrane protein 1 (PAAT family) [Lentzea flaviverrucosa]SES50645.1 glutamate transport system permease protein [Lentzea flaviverrucosa]